MEDLARLDEAAAETAFLTELRRRGLDPRTLRWCEWPGCVAHYDANDGPHEAGWVRRHRYLTSLMCPEHSTSPHYPGLDLVEPKHTTVIAKCGCGESAHVQPSNFEAALAWWDGHLERLGLAPHVFERPVGYGEVG